MPGDELSELASISVPVLSQAPEVCVGLWYHMLGPSVSSLDLLVQTVCTRWHFDQLFCTQIFVGQMCIANYHQASYFCVFIYFTFF